MTTVHYEFHYHVASETIPDWWLPIAGDERHTTADDALHMGRPFMKLGGRWRLVKVTTTIEIIKEFTP